MSVEEKGGYGITGHYGKGGSGKSRDIVETDIIPALQAGRKVITNLPLLVDGILTYFHKIDYRNIILCTHEELVQKMVARMARGKDDPGEFAHALICWDEIQDVFPAGFKRRGTGKEAEKFDLEREAFIGYLAWSRHDDSEFIWATQHYSSVDVELRRKTHIYVQHEHLFHLGLKKRWAARTQLPDQQTGDPNPGAGTVRTFGENQIIFRCYRSAEVGNHKASSRQKMMIPKKIIIVSILALVAITYTVVTYIRQGSPLDAQTYAKASAGAIDVPTLNGIDPSKSKSNEKGAKQNGYALHQVESIICMHGLCHGIDAGVIVRQWRQQIVSEIDTTPSTIRIRLLEGNVQRLGNGSRPIVPGL